MHHMVIVGKTHELPTGAVNVNMTPAAQCAGRIGRGDIHCVEIARFSLRGHHAASVMEIILPVCVWIFRPMNKDVLLGGRMYRHHADVRTMMGAINHLNVTAIDVHALNRFAGK